MVKPRLHKLANKIKIRSKAGKRPLIVNLARSEVRLLRICPLTRNEVSYFMILLRNQVIYLLRSGV